LLKPPENLSGQTHQALMVSTVLSGWMSWPLESSFQFHQTCRPQTNDQMGCLICLSRLRPDQKPTHTTQMNVLEKQSGEQQYIEDSDLTRLYTL
jgi:hypothetical protein